MTNIVILFITYLKLTGDNDSLKRQSKIENDFFFREREQYEIRYKKLSDLFYEQNKEFERRIFNSDKENQKLISENKFLTDQNTILSLDKKILEKGLTPREISILRTSDIKISEKVKEFFGKFIDSLNK